MPFFTVSALTAVTAAVGAVAGVAGTLQSGQAARDASRASREQEQIRRQQLELENIRRQRAIIRQTQAARAQAIASASTRGVSNSDVLPGALGQIETQSGAALLAQSENTQLSRGIFDTNAAISEARADAARGQAISDFGRTLFSNAQAIGRIGNTLYNTDLFNDNIIGGDDGGRV